MKKRLLIVFVIVNTIIVPVELFAATGFNAELLLGQTLPSNTSYPRVSAGSDNTIYVVWSQDDGDATSIFFARSLDGGLSFEEKREIEKKSQV